ncbi:MAG: type II toxin-antitoxin system Phd/YefM family antitoxin [Campylobacterota bacterium]|nr:type II toxin-antitoxin system Phd/YefM family antitoxin [Campylobacterota bacterium]
MQTVGIRDLQTNPAVLTRSLENNEFVLITKSGKPLGVATSFDDDILRHGFLDNLVLEAFKKGDVSFSQLSKSLKLNKSETMEFLKTMNIPITDYNIKEELKGIKSFLK